MSIMSLLGLILAIPAGFIITKLGVKWATIITAAVNLVGSLVGTFATGFAVMMMSRALEGVALGLCNVTAFAVVAAFFPPEKRGLPNSFVTVSYVVSYFMMMNVAVPITDGFQWQGLWWFCNILSVIALAVAFLIPKKVDEPNFDEGAENKTIKEKVNYGRLLKNPSIWIVPLVFVFFNIGYYGISTYMPTFLVEDVGASQDAANLAVSWNALAGLPAAVVVGLILDKLKISARKFVPAITMAALAVCYFLAFQMPTIPAATFLLIFVGFICTFVPVSLYTIGPDIIPKPAYAALILAIVTLGQNVGMTLGPLVIGYTFETFQTWAACSIPIGAMVVLGAVLCFFIKVKGNSE
jgi:predicted MFS family arabinose efflux permease